jgi:DNA-binding NarL/FixJ family response regulator
VPSLKILVVDDYERYRRFVSSVLHERAEFLIWEASDGLEAVEKASELQPDLILLDIGLPRLDGIEAGRRIREVSPNSKILFVSLESSDDVVQEALRLGAQGYLLKSDAAGELLPAVDAVLQGKRFLSRRLAARGAGRTQEKETTRVHEVAWYRDDASFVDDFARFVEAALEVGRAVIVIATASHRSAIMLKLQARGWDIPAAIREGSYTSLDAGETLSTFMVNDRPSVTRLTKMLEELLEAAVKAAKGKHPKVVVCGECAPTLLAQGKVEAAMEVERLWDDMTRKYQFDLLCGYANESQPKEDSYIFQRICAEHSAAYSL